MVNENDRKNEEEMEKMDDQMYDNEVNLEEEDEPKVEEENNEELKEQKDEEENVETDQSSEEESVSIEELEKKLEETTNRLLRVQADYENFRRRTRQEREADAKYRSQRLVEELLPVLDNFERALSMKAESEEGKNFLQGMEMVYKQLLEALNKEGVSVIEAVGKPFDPHVHQAVMQVQVEDEEKDIVVEELQKGYMLKDRVIRPSMVKVNG